jgi:hypothetical protein
MYTHSLLPHARHRLALLVLLAGSTACAGPRTLAPSAPNPNPVPPPPIPQATSTLSVPIRIAAKPAADAITQQFREAVEPFGTHSEVKWNDKDGRDFLRWAVRPHADLRFDFADDGLRVGGGIEYDFEFKDVLGKGLTSKVVPDIYIRCPSQGQGDWPRFRLQGSTPLSLDAEWKPRILPKLHEFNVYSNEKRDECKFTVIVDFDISNRMAGILRPKLEDELQKLPKLAEALPVRSSVERLWKRTGEPIRLDDRTWLVVDPQRIEITQPFGPDGTTPLGFREGHLHFQTSLVAKPRIVIGEKPAAPLLPELPALTPANTAEGIDLTLDSNIPLADLSTALNSAIEGRVVPVGKRKVTLQSAEVLGVLSDTLYIKAKFHAGRTARGVLYLKGRPTYNAVSGQLRIDDLDYDLETKSVVLKVADWMAGEEIQKFFQKEAVWDLRPHVSTLTGRLNGYLNRPLSEGVQIEGQVVEITPVGIWMTPEGAVARVHVKGRAALSVDLSGLQDQ